MTAFRNRSRQQTATPAETRDQATETVPDDLAAAAEGLAIPGHGIARRRNRTVPRGRSR